MSWRWERDYKPVAATGKELKVVLPLPEQHELLKGSNWERIESLTYTYTIHRIFDKQQLGKN